MASIGDVVARVRAACERARRARGALVRAEDSAREAHELLRRALEGAVRLEPEVAVLLSRFAEVVDGCGGYLRPLLAEALEAAEGIANRLAGEGAPDPTATTQPRRRAPESNNSGSTAERMGELLNALPVRADPGGKTSGYWVDRTGQVHGPVTSGRGELRERAVEGLRRLGLAPARGTLTVADHVEVQVAVQVQEISGADATLAVNNRPCDFGPLSCDRIVPRVLRPGQSLTVYWPGGVKTYTGKGR